MILVSFMGFVSVPDMMKHTKCVFDIPLLCKSKMAAKNLYQFLENVSFCWLDFSPPHFHL